MYRRKDTFYARAKSVGYRSRAAFKLEQLAQQAPLFRKGDRVIDIGAWPGGWLQVAARRVGPSGRVIGVDLQAIDPLPEPNVVTIQGDVTDPSIQERIRALCGGHADVVLSDVAPKLTGVAARDQAQAHALAECALQVAAQMLRPGGTLVVKLFMGPDFQAYLAQVRGMFRDVRTTRPEATRKQSAEIYAIARDFGRGLTTPRP